MSGTDNVKEKLQRIKDRYGLATAMAGIMLFSGTEHNLKSCSKIEKVKPVAVKKEMKYQDMSDAILMAMLVMTEGCSLDAYIDAVGVGTYGVGSTYTKEGKRVRMGDKLSSVEEAFEVVDRHVKEEIEWVFDYIDRKLQPWQKAAVESFAYNCGAGVIVKNGKLTKLGEAINNGDDGFVAKEMLTYNRGGGSFLSGLFFRRVLEAGVYQGFVSLDDLENCVIGGVGNVSSSKEMCDIFNLKTTKWGRRGKTKGSFDDDPITDASVIDKVITLCQKRIEGVVSARWEKFHIGEVVANFLPAKFSVVDAASYQKNKALQASKFMKTLEEMRGNRKG